MSKITDIHIENNMSHVTSVINDKMVLASRSLFVFQLNNELIPYLRSKPGEIDGIIICHLPFEKGFSEYKDKLGQLFKHIIFVDQTAVDNVLVLNESVEYYNATNKIIEANARKIEKLDFKLFPQVNTCSFNKRLSRFTASLWLGDDDNSISYWVAFAQEHYPVTEDIPIGINPLLREPYKSSGDYFEIKPPPETEDSSDSLSTQQQKQYWKVEIEEKITMRFKGMYGKIAGNLSLGVDADEGDIIITRRTRPDEYHIVDPDALKDDDVVSDAMSESERFAELVKTSQS